MASRPVNIPGRGSSSRAPTSPHRSSALESMISLPWGTTTPAGSSRPSGPSHSSSHHATLPTLGSMPIRNNARLRAGASPHAARDRLANTIQFEPRVIRADAATLARASAAGSGSSEPPCPTPIDTTESGTGAPLPVPSPSSATRTRRPSATGGGSIFGSPAHGHGMRRPSLHGIPTAAASFGPSIGSTPSHQAPAPFARPSYLDHSALRHLLVTDSAAGTTTAPSVSHDRMSSAPSESMDSDAEDDRSPTPPAFPPPVATAPPANPPSAEVEYIQLPTRWSEHLRNPQLDISPDGRELTYGGSSSGTERESPGAAAARTDYPIPPACGLYYFEVEILRARTGSNGSNGSKARISIGMAATGVSISRLPGWDTRSWGYHGDDGCSYASQDTGTKYGDTFGTGDVVGCGIDFTTHKAFFTKNGRLIGAAFPPLDLTAPPSSTSGSGNTPALLEIYPSVGMKYPHDSVRVNLGQDPFRFDIDGYVQQVRDGVWAAVMRMPIDIAIGKPQSAGIAKRRIKKGKEGKEEEPTEFEGKPNPMQEEEEQKEVLNKFVLEYLDHHGYVKTAQALKRKASESQGMEDGDVDMDIDAGSASGPSENNFHRRTGIVNAVLRGEIDEAIEGLKNHFPKVLDAPDDPEYAVNMLLLKLHCRKFVELVLESVKLDRRIKELTARQSSTGKGRQTMDGVGPTADGDEDVCMDNDYRIGEDPAEKVDASKLSAQRNGMLQQAIAYGQSLRTDYDSFEQDEAVAAILKRSWGILAWLDPVAAGGVAAEVASDEARKELAEEVRRGILISQGRPTHPLLEKVYRQTAVTLLQLGMLGNGSAAFVDMQKEFLEA